MRQAEVIVEVPFFDVDAMEIVWHGHYVKYFELARCEFLKQINYDYLQMAESGYGFPIVDIRLKYVASATFGSAIRVVAELVEWDCYLKFHYIITDVASGKVLTKGMSKQVAVSRETGEMCYESPEILLHRLGVK
ncbi:acyl-CoA thioesterase [Aliidiomarina indica]|uniref:acyl-CoA thioesterase n=1 Tax=Aliidiomarina indica TaxID=2749147 RepID=UPI00188F55E0|nr:acyl-CoA thioesterase [Aliidiomarina indica]